MEKMDKLAQLFAKYKIYSNVCYHGHSPVKVFQGMFPHDHYSQDLKAFLLYQNYEPEQRGADLPWWGKEFFTKKTGFRTLIVAQDSTAKDAGSIVLFAHLMPIINNLAQYRDYANRLNAKNSFRFNSWNKMRNQLIEWNINFDFLYITDAAKVYKKSSWKDKNFDKKKSQELLKAEIKFCNPDLIILLGSAPLYLLDGTKNYASVVENGKHILMAGRRCIVAPFPIGNGPTQQNFKTRLEIATDLIKNVLILG